MPAAVNRIRRAGDPARARRGEKENQFRDFFCCADASQGMRRFAMFEKLRVPRLFHPAGAMQFRHNDAGIDRVHTHALACQL